MSLSRRPSAALAFSAGCLTVLRMPGLVVIACAMTLASAVPFGLVLGERLRGALEQQPPIALEAEEIDAEWWFDYRANATGLAATFTPAIVGFAAPLSNISALVDASPRAAFVAIPIVMALLMWSSLWGGIIDRCYRGGTLRSFAAAAIALWPRVGLVTAIAALIVLLLYVTIHPLLFGPLFSQMAAVLPGEREAFVARVGLYLVFGALLAGVSLVADYTRIAAVQDRSIPLRTAAAAALRFIRVHARAVLLLYLLIGVLLAGLFVTYGLADRRFLGWRAVMVGQAFVFARIALRVISVASQVSLVKSAYGAESRAPR